MRKFILLLTIIFLLTGCANYIHPVYENEILMTQPIEDDIVLKPTEIVEPDIIIDTEIAEVAEPTQPPAPYYELLNIEQKGRDIITYGEFDEEKIKALESILDSYNPNISLAIYSLNGEKGLIYNGQQTYFSACTIKIPWMLYLCMGIDEGKYNKDDILIYEEKYYHDGSGTIQHTAYGSQYTVEELITLCLSISDNVAYEMLIDYIDRDDFYKYIDTLDCPSLHVPLRSIWSNNSVVRDYIRIWQVVYEYSKTNTTGSNILMNACTNTKFAYGVKTLNGEDYSHKSGDNFGSSCAYNDAGIVWSEVPYTYAIFTKSEGTNYDEKVVDNVMTIVHEMF